MTEPLPAWPRDTTRVRVTPAHVRKGKPGSALLCAAALAVAEALLSASVKVTVDVDEVTAHEAAPPFRWWHAETPEEVAEWTAELDAGCERFTESAARAAEQGLLDFELSWREGNPDNAAAAAREDKSR